MSHLAAATGMVTSPLPNAATQNQNMMNLPHAKIHPFMMSYAASGMHQPVNSMPLVPHFYMDYRLPMLAQRELMAFNRASQIRTGFPSYVTETDLMFLEAKRKLAMMQHEPSLSGKISFPQNTLCKDQTPTNLALSSCTTKVQDTLTSRLAAGPVSSSVHKDDELTQISEPKAKKQRREKKALDMPRRALSAYNIFFSEQRDMILKEIDGDSGNKSSGTELKNPKDDSATTTDEVPDVLNRNLFPARRKRAHRKVHGKIGLVKLAKTVSQRWKDLSDEKRKYYQELAEKDRQRHKEAMERYYEKKSC